MKRGVILFGAAVLAAAGLIFGVWWRRNGNNSSYRTAKVDRGDIVQTVKATGTVKPLLQVQVGTQVTGPVKKLYVDFNDLVRAGQIVAQIDPAAYQARVAQDEANLKRALAEVEQAQARLKQSERELERARELNRRDLISASELDGAVAERDTLAAQLKLARAGVEQARAALEQSRTNLDYTTIRSPVDGVVVARNVDEGQTVVASLSAQTLFVIATDLKQVQVEASIPEADIGKIRTGQPVHFTVDAYPDQEFHGAVTEVRLAAVTQQNVVTYPVIISAANSDLRLLPTMTANLTVEVARREQVLRVPNAALRFKYTPPEEASVAAPAISRTERERRVWVLEGKKLKPAVITPGISDGFFTEVAGGPLKEGQEVVVGMMESQQGSTGANNPFAPKFPSRPGRPH